MKESDLQLSEETLDKVESVDREDSISFDELEVQFEIDRINQNVITELQERFREK